MLARSLLKQMHVIIPSRKSMAVTPDLLLNIKTPSSAAKAASAPSKPASQPSRDEPSSFANVYAKERQAKPAGSSEGAPKAPRDKPVNEKPSQETDNAGGTEKPPVTEAGNELPAEVVVTDGETQAAEVELDPLLLFGMGGQPDAGSPQAVDVPTPTGSEFLVGLAQVQTVMTSNDGEPEAAEDSSLEPLTQKTPLFNLGKGDEASAEAQDVIPAALLVEEEPSEGADELGLEEGFGELLDKLDASTGSRPSAADAAINRLNPLAQAVTQQNQLQQAQRTPIVPGPPVQMQQGGWSEAVVDRVMWLSSQNLKSAEIQLDPAELGRMEVRIDMSKDQTQVTFVSPHANVRDALEGQMQRLRDMFSQQGMTMDVNVSDQSKGWRGEGGGESSGRGKTGVSAAAEEDVILGSTQISSSRAGGDRGLVDYYA